MKEGRAGCGTEVESELLLQAANAIHELLGLLHTRSPLRVSPAVNRKLVAARKVAKELRDEYESHVAPNSKEVYYGNADEHAPRDRSCGRTEQRQATGRQAQAHQA